MFAFYNHSPRLSSVFEIFLEHMIAPNVPHNVNENYRLIQSTAKMLKVAHPSPSPNRVRGGRLFPRSRPQLFEAS
jgi:hypothetical protein